MTTKPMSNRLFVSVLTLAILACASLSASAYTPSPTIDVRTEDELKKALTLVRATDAEFTIVLASDVSLQSSTELVIPRGWHVIIDMQSHNFTGTGSLTIVPEDTTVPPPHLGQLPPAEPHITLRGSTGMFNRGLNVSGGIHLHYDGIYAAGQVDMFGSVLGKHPDNTDHIYFDNPYSDWNASAPSTQYIDYLPDDTLAPNYWLVPGVTRNPAFDLPAFLAGNDPAGNPNNIKWTPEGTIVVGWAGGAYLEIAAENIVTNTETIVGAKETSRAHDLTPTPTNHTKSPKIPFNNRTTDHGHGGVIYLHDEATWKGLGTFYIGYDGQGEVYIDEKARLQVGTIEIGRNDPGTYTSLGWLEIADAGSMITLFGRDDKAIQRDWTVSPVTGEPMFDANGNVIPILGSERGASEGMGVLIAEKNATIYFDSRATLDNKPSGYSPKITLGSDAILLDPNTGSQLTVRSTVDDSYIAGAVQGMTINSKAPVGDAGWFNDPRVRSTGMNNAKSGYYIPEPYNKTQVGTANIYLQHLDKNIDGYNIVFINDFTLEDREVKVSFDVGEYAGFGGSTSATPGTIFVTRGEFATYDDVVAALNDIKTWEDVDPSMAYNPAVDNPGARPFEGGFRLLDSRGHVMNGSEVLPHLLGTPVGTPWAVAMVLNTPEVVETNKIIGPMTGASLTFQNSSVLEGSMEITLADTVFNGNSVLTPGFGSYNVDSIKDPLKHLAFGRIDIVGDLRHGYTLDAAGTGYDRTSDAHTFIDFNVHGNDELVKNPAVEWRAWDNNIYLHHYLGDKGRDTISVTGTAHLAGDITFRPQSGYYADTLDIHFLEANNVVGEYDTVHLYPNRWFRDKYDVRFDRTIDGADAYSRGILEDQGDGMHLVLNRNETPFTDTARTYNTRAVAGTLDEIWNKQTRADWLPVLNWLWLMNDDELRVAMQQLCGETRASSFYMPIRSPWRFAYDRVNWTTGGGRVYFGQQNLNAVKLSKSDIWANVFYDSLEMKDDKNSNKSATQRASFMAGYDRSLSHSSSLGFVFSHGNPKMQQGWATVNADDYLFGVHYANKFDGRYELKSWASYGFQQYHMNRYIPIELPRGTDREDLYAKYSGNTVALSAQVARPYSYRDWVFRPYAAADVSMVHQNASHDEGYEAISLDYKSGIWSQLYGRVGLRADYAWERFNITTTLSYSHLLIGNQGPYVKNKFIIEGDWFQIQGNRLGCGFLDFGAGTQIYLAKQSATPQTSRWAQFKEQSLAFLQYNGSVGIRSAAHTASISYQYAF